MRPSMLEVFDILKGVQSEIQLEEGQEIKQEELQSLCPPTVFSYKELDKATSCFSATGLISNEGYYKIYLGILRDGRMAEVKVLKENAEPLEVFWKEVSILTRTCHKNVVALYGYTSPATKKKNLVTLYGYAGPATKKHMIVQEFVPNGTLADHLYGQRPALPLAVRIEIAIETASALEHLHSLQPSIIHRDVKANNILLDNNFHVKVSGFDLCYIMTGDATSEHAVNVCGTLCYLDPEYISTQIISTKSDIYGFGVVLLQLISGKRALYEKQDVLVYLGEEGTSYILNNELDELADPRLGYHSNSETRRMIQELARLASSCLHESGGERPSMMVVLMALNDIRYGTQWRYDTYRDEPDDMPVEEEQSSWELTEGR